jgi:hypothetical protein
MRPILAAILSGISMAALAGSPGGGGGGHGGGGGGGHGGGSSGGHASSSAHGSGPRASASAHLSAAAHGAPANLTDSLRSWWHHRHQERTGYSNNATVREILCTDERRRLVNCDREQAVRER